MMPRKRQKITINKMWLIKIVFCVWTLLQLSHYVASVTAPAKKPPVKPCNKAFKCSDKGPGVYATDGIICYKFPNDCQLASKNCQRRNEFKTRLKRTSKKYCRKLCPRNCSEKHPAPVCAEVKGREMTYVNDCKAKMASCKAKQSLHLIHHGPCRKQCSKSCPTKHYPVCAACGHNKRRITFGNKCVMQNHNCQNAHNGAKLCYVLHKGKCKRMCNVKYFKHKCRRCRRDIRPHRRHKKCRRRKHKKCRKHRRHRRHRRHKKPKRHRKKCRRHGKKCRRHRIPYSNNNHYKSY